MKEKGGATSDTIGRWSENLIRGGNSFPAERRETLTITSRKRNKKSKVCLQSMRVLEGGKET